MQRTPLVFISHSLGGIIVKKALILAHERSSDPEFKDILDNVKSIAFLGVPHGGSDVAFWGNIAAHVLRAATLGTTTNSQILENLQKSSTGLTDISKQFVDRGKDLQILTFFETQKLKGSVVCSLSFGSIEQSS